MSQKIRVFAPAKINLFLHVTGKTSDGYHTLSSFVVFSDNFGDEITIEASDRFSLILDPKSSQHVSTTDNLIETATKALANHLNRAPNVKITLKKYIPVGAGLGGGSSDAAHTIRGLLKLWQEDAPEDLSQLLLNIGADVPVCYHAKPCLMRGIGEKIEPYPYTLPDHDLMLITSDNQLLTKDVFKAYNGAFAPDITVQDIPKWKTAEEMISWLKENTGNCLEQPALATLPELKDNLPIENKDTLLRITGSGPTFFSLRA